MRPIKQWIAAALVTTVALGMTIAAADAQTKKVIRINHAGADDILGTEHQMFSWIFANYVNQRAPTLDVRIFPNSGLGQSRQVIEAMQLGSGASMHIGGMAEFANFCQARCGVIGLPFIFKGYDHVQRVLDGPVGAALSAELEKVGFKTLGYMYSWGYRNVVTARKEIKTVADLKGLKIRTIPTPIFVGAINAMGASATPMNFGEIYTSLQSGVLDGFEHTASTTLSFKFHEIAKYVALTQHLIDPTVVAFSSSEWGKLDAKEQAIVTEGAKLAIDIARAMSSVREAESLAQLKKLGMTITQPDMTEARAKAADVQKEMAAKIKAEDLLAQILAE
jgi:tripartite ATP-independent transporter DctP family solute receptor